MESSTVLVKEQETKVLAALGRSWGWVLAFGVLTLVLGLLALVYPGKTLVLVAVLFGVQLLVSGVFQLVSALGKAADHRVLLAILGILSILVGIFSLRHAFQTIAILALLLGAYWVVNGIMNTFVAISEEGMPNRGLTIFTSILGFVAGLVVLSYPIGSMATLAAILGAWLSVFGVLGIVAALRLRSAAAAGGSAPDRA